MYFKDIYKAILLPYSEIFGVIYGRIFEIEICSSIIGELKD